MPRDLRPSPKWGSMKNAVVGIAIAALYIALVILAQKFVGF